MHSLSTRSWVSSVIPQPLHILSLYFPLKLFFTSSILVLALNMVLTWYLFSFSMYSSRFPIFLILVSRNLTFDFFFLCSVSFFQCSFYLGLGVFLFVVFYF